ncbi:hypothetical protein [Alkalihalobacillus deserti]|uniref:hypothetical protein n=1 Tax=Alkalihalobacillus deserti TaxID=2879466 RepID=UPI001D1347F3|nr:hypothetical protein [Alkalihalobacillus deserti]
MVYQDSSKMKVTVVDSIISSGKTSWAIQYMKKAPTYKKFIYITPFKNEVERIMLSVNREFKQLEVDPKGEIKLGDIKRLIADGENIISTVEPFKCIDCELFELLEMEHYTLILDEVKNVIEEVDISWDDLKILLENEVIEVSGKGNVHWKKTDYSEGSFEQIKNLANSGNLMLYKDEESEPVLMYWTFPIEVLKNFDDVFILHTCLMDKYSVLTLTCMD